MPKLDIKNAVSGGIPPIDYANYKLHVKKASYGLSKSAGNPLITLVCEIVSPDKITRFDKEWNVAGTEVTYWLTLVDSQLGRVRDTLDKLNLLDTLGDIDTDDPATKEVVETAFDRLTFDALLWSQEKVKHKMPTPEQRIAHQEGDAILDADGKRIKLGYEIVATLDNIVGNPEFVSY